MYSDRLFILLIRFLVSSPIADGFEGYLGATCGCQQCLRRSHPSATRFGWYCEIWGSRPSHWFPVTEQLGFTVTYALFRTSPAFVDSLKLLYPTL